MKTITGLGGYEFYLDDTWIELTEEEKRKFNINPSILNYLVNYTKRKEFFVNSDSYYDSKDDLDAFFDLCKNMMIRNNFVIVDEEKFVSVNSWDNQTIEAYKLLSRLPNGILQASYFMRLTGKTINGYLYGCLTTKVSENHDENEDVLVGVIKNWKYIDN